IFADALESGAIKPSCELEVLSEHPASIMLDAGHGFGPVGAKECVRRAVTKASQCGVAAVTVKRLGDVARLGGYLIEPAKEGYIVMMMANDSGGNGCVTPYGGLEPMFSTNPLAVG